MFFKIWRSIEKQIYLALAELRVTLLSSELGTQGWEELHSPASLTLGFFCLGAWLRASIFGSSSSSRASSFGPFFCHCVPQRGQTRPPWNTRNFWNGVFQAVHPLKRSALVMVPYAGKTYFSNSTDEFGQYNLHSGTVVPVRNSQVKCQIWNGLQTIGKFLVKVSIII